MSDDRTQRMPALEKEPSGGEDGGSQQSGSSAGHDPGEGEGGGRAGRFWSQRRIPAAVVSLLLLAAAGVLLYDVASVRAGRSAMSWRRTVADKLATTSLDHPVVLAATALAVLLGLWLLLLAATPGIRRLLPMRKESADLGAGLERDAAGLILRDRAMTVSGVESAQVDVKRRKVRARAQAHFRDLDDVRGDLDTALADGIRKLGLAKRLRLSVQVRRPKKR